MTISTMSFDRLLQLAAAPPVKSAKGRADSGSAPERLDAPPSARRAEAALPATATADAIIAAGCKRRAELPTNDRPKGLALQIVNAGRAARGEKPL
ncbi:MULTISPECIES: hypothetical protein [unclassified Bradyrhizobium]|uniref:hypothetical protein n=1 Tax=unclassified Bradyrhizobium TaxID=2631580 RepID=UPI002915E63F|nr:MULTISPECIES: hypothetical protein [unclassified Bradyrhizobium]